MRAVNPHLHARQSRAYAAALLASAARVHVDPALVMAVVTVESGWNERAISIHGAEGLGQLKPETARGLGVDPWSARANLRGVALYLHRLLAFFGPSRHALTRAIAGYNAGPYAVVNAGGAIPNNGQTPRYVAKVMSAWHHFRTRFGKTPTITTVAATLDAPRAVERREAAYWGVR
ncbi:MAG: lytic transglycosylase domain-containing protein [Candidatus Eremiobacteraeota bacterium]|nr:lytic transglycosylase domain-containing protein [Candidatus Eremiobacteraeota bacterium]